MGLPFSVSKVWLLELVVVVVVVLWGDFFEGKGGCWGLLVVWMFGWCLVFSLVCLIIFEFKHVLYYQCSLILFSVLFFHCGSYFLFSSL